MKKADVDRMVEEMTANRMRERTKELAEQAGFIFWSDCDWKPEGEVIDWSSNYDDELEKFAELVREDEMNERIRELAIQSGLIAPYGSDHEGLRDFDYRKFAELVRADEAINHFSSHTTITQDKSSTKVGTNSGVLHTEWVGLTPIEFNSIKDTATTIGYAIIKTEAKLKEKNGG